MVSKTDRKTSILLKEVGNELQAKISETERTIRRITNVELVRFSWQIGFLLNKFFADLPKKGEHGSHLTTISSILSTAYGAHFSKNNIRKMREFAMHYPEPSNESEYVHYLSWEHILCLLEIKDSASRKFFLIQKIEKALTVGQLKSFVLSSRKKLIHTSRAIPRINPELILLNGSAMPNRFGRQSGKALMTGKITLSDKSNQFNNLLTELVQEIDKYQFQENQWLKSTTSIFFWNIGKHIEKSLAKLSDERGRAKIINHIAASLKTRKAFNEDQLGLMIQFAQRFSTEGFARLASALLTWAEISDVLNLSSEKEIRNYYTQLSKRIGFNKNHLALLLSVHSYSLIDKGEKTVPKIKSTRTKTVKVEKHQKSIMIQIIEDLEIEHLTRPSIFKNEKFIDWMMSYR